MKPTNEERREVAAKLRRLAERHEGVPWFLIEKYLGLVSDEGFVAGSVFTSECGFASCAVDAKFCPECGARVTVE